MPTLQQFIDESVSRLSFDPIQLDSLVPLDRLPTPALTIDLGKQSANVEIVVDYNDGASLFNQRASQAGLVLTVLVDLDPGMGRTGITPGAKALALARHIIDTCPGLKFGGLQMYIGDCMQINGFDKRRDKYTSPVTKRH